MTQFTHHQTFDHFVRWIFFSGFDENIFTKKQGRIQNYVPVNMASVRSAFASGDYKGNFVMKTEQKKICFISFGFLYQLNGKELFWIINQQNRVQ